jgi:hypothetical protein
LFFALDHAALSYSWPSPVTDIDVNKREQNFEISCLHHVKLKGKNELGAVLLMRRDGCTILMIEFDASGSTTKAAVLLTGLVDASACVAIATRLELRRALRGRDPQPQQHRPSLPLPV